MKNRVIMCFDFDGVIIDNTAWGFKKINLILSEIGMQPVSEDFLRQNWGKRVDDLFSLICWQQGGGKSHIEAFGKREAEIDPGSCAIDPKILKALVSLKEAGLMTALITNRNRARLDAYVDRIGLDLHIFDHVQTIDDGLYHKPDGRVFFPLIKKARKYGLSARNIAYFGNTINSDFQAVKNVRRLGHAVKFIGVCSGITTPEEFAMVNLQETEIIASHDDLPFYLGRIAQEAKKELIELF